jgi:hypothetical protein
MLAVLIEKLPIKIPLFMYTGNIYGDSRRGRIVKVMIVFEQLDMKTTTPYQNQQRKL